MKTHYSIVIAFLWVIGSFPALAQKTVKPFYFQLSYGQSFLWSNSSPRYTLISPEVKLGFGFTREWNRVEFSAAALVGIRYGTTKDFTHQPHINEAKLYMLLLERHYSYDLEFLEIPFTIGYYLLEDKLSLHGGLSARWYFTNHTSATGFSGFLEDIPIDRLNIGILTMLKFRVSPQIGVSIDYFMGLKKLNVATFLNGNKEYHLTGSFAQVSLYIKPFHVKNRE